MDDWSMMMAHFPVLAARVRSLLPSSALRPARLVPGVAVVSVGGLEYRRGDVGPYNEVMVGVPVLFRPRIDVPAVPLLLAERLSSFGVYAHAVPVTTQRACEVGVAGWGFRKFVAQVTFADLGAVRRCHMQADGQHILTLTMRKPPGKVSQWNFTVYTAGQARLLRSRVKTTGTYAVTVVRGGAWLRLGQHPLAQQLRELRIGRVAVASRWGERLQSLLFPPEPVEAARPAGLGLLGGSHPG
jgi:hypothetical protein